MKKMLYIVLGLLLINFVYAQEGMVCRDVERLCYEGCKTESQEVKTYIDKTKADIQKDTEGLGYYLLDEFKKEINSFVRKVILSFSISVLGIMLIIEGIIGYIRIKKEQDLLLSINEKIGGKNGG